MKLLYIFSFLILYIELLMVKKSNDSKNIIISIIYNFCIIYFLNLLIAFFLTIIDLKNTLLSFSIIYIAIALLFFCYYKKKYKRFNIQNYYLKKKDLFFLIIIFLICLTIGILRYSLYFNNVNYEIGDSAIHYKMSLEYSEYQKLFLNYTKNDIINYNHTMYGYYVPCGLFMQLTPFSTITSYNIFNTIVLFILAACFYATLLKIRKEKNIFFAFLLTLLYILAYPLNDMIFGFGYLGIGILSVNLIILTFNLFNIEKQENKKPFYFLLSLFNYGLFCSYFLFVPAVYLSEFIYIIYLFKTKKICSKNTIKIILISLIIPFIYGCIFFVKNIVLSSSENIYAIQGYNYQNLIGNFLLILPISCYSVYEQAKKNNFNIELSLLIFLLIYTLITFIILIIGFISPYYFYKIYYITWLVVNIHVFKLSNYKKYKKIILVNYTLIVLSIIFSFYDIEKLASKQITDFKYSGILKEVNDIYHFNKDKILKPSIRITPSRMELIKSPQKHQKECKPNQDGYVLPYIASYYHQIWYYNINEYYLCSNYEMYLLRYGLDENIDQITYYFKNENSYGVSDREISDSNYSAFLEYPKLKCLLVDNSNIKELKKYDFNNDYDILFENKSGKLLRKKE